jgi:predicted O-methyltransferase YrrM
LKKDKTRLDIVDFGTGGKQNKSIAEITRTSLKTPGYGRLFYRLAVFLKARNILELGTSLGLTSSYLASPSSGARMVSMEGSEDLAAIARENFKLLGIDNIEIVTGNIDLTLAKVVEDFSQLDLVFIDANHRSEAVLNYFEQIMVKIRSGSIVVVDDIYWSEDMEKAWKTIKQHPRVTSTIDLFQMGIVFFNEDLHKKNYKMRF